MQLSVFHRSRKKLQEAFESYISDEGPTITRVTASTTEVTSCAAALEVKQISPERNFEEKLKGKKKAWHWNLCRSSNSYCISDEQRRSPSPTPPPTPARPVPQQNQPPKTNCASKRACGGEPETIGTRRRISLSPSYSLLHNCLIPHKSTVACYVLPFNRQQ